MFRERLNNLRQRNTVRIITDRHARTEGEGAGTKILIGAGEYLNFSSNDYLGLCFNNSIMTAAKQAVDSYGFGAGSSRLLSGGTMLHGKLEREIAAFKGTGSALVFNSGYAANTGTIPAIAGQDTVIFSDELNHASIIDGCRLSRAKKIIYPHRDTTRLSELMQDERGPKMVITESVFSMDGDIAPLREIHELCLCHDALLYIDDAHGTGVLGGGYGVLRHFGLEPSSRIIQMGTFSKAFGSFGGFVAGDRNVIEWLINTGRSFIFSTALPACVLAASLAALEIVRNDDGLVRRLWTNRERLYQGIKGLGFSTTGSESPIIPVIPPYPGFSSYGDDIANTLKFSEYLMENGIYAPAIRPPTVKVPRIRFTVTAAHTDDDIDRLLEVLRSAGKS
jgi:8-amino-7-oxononanoate synthase